MLRNLVAAALSIFVVGVAGPAAGEEKPLVTFNILSLNTALELANVALKDCQKKGFQVAVVVVDRFGGVQVALRDRFAGVHTVETARRKAWTAVSFRTDTLAMADATKVGEPQSGVRFVTGALMAGGGVQVEAKGSIVAGIGVSGAPGGKEDDACARVGIEAITDKLEF